MEDIMKIKSPENSIVSLKGVTKIIENETKKQKGGLLVQSMQLTRADVGFVLAA